MIHICNIIDFFYTYLYITSPNEPINHNFTIAYTPHSLYML